MVGRALLLSEKKLSELELIVTLTAWAVSRYSNYLHNAPRVALVVPSKAEVQCLRCRSLPPRVLSRLLVLQMYGVDYVAGKSIWMFFAGVIVAA